MNSKYQYDYLPTGSIRLLRLVSVEPEITLEVEHVSLDTNPPYNALSYTWGEPVFTQRVLIGNHFLNVTPSLHGCLKCFEQYIGTKVWIDALCINQTDDEEKSRQVQGMDRVYRQATKVLIWLGAEDNGVGQAMKGIETYGKAAIDAGLMNLTPEHLTSWPDMGQEPKLVETKNALLGLMQIATDSEGDDSRKDERLPRVALAELTRRPYFVRVWVKQEITLAQDAVVLCGQHMTTIERLHAIILFYSMLITWEFQELRAGRATRIPGPFSEEELLAADDVWELQKTAIPQDSVGFALSGRRSYRMSGPEPLHRLLQRSFVRPSMDILQCKDPRDKIWGVSGIASDMKDMGLVASYKNSVEQVYEATARALLQQGHVDILKWCRRSKELNLPSWVPNWSLPIRPTWSDDTGKPLFKVTGEYIQPQHESKPTTTAGSISLQGFAVDVITECGLVWKADLDKAFDHHASLVMINELNGFLDKHDYSEMAKREILWRTPIGDKELPESSPYFIRATQRSERQFYKLISKVMDSDMKETTYSYQSCMNYNYLSRPVNSNQGLVGLGPSETEPGDVIVFLFGGSTPFILRPRSGDQEGYSVIGEAYFCGLMDGEVIDACSPMETFELW
ncbi:hypothetical protein FSARC_13255 [Fusarium sarcochroum]|uniref:Heterokaryon incompatibility domain-containing protein n=1 Tax=Fusarium sarcochroum TaxID=1208366 RepID=A0A8H4T2T3_9HYPO|nr:hypothetical protein FSARC_13255 [Fusarium sarcochroum]